MCRCWRARARCVALPRTVFYPCGGPRSVLALKIPSFLRRSYAYRLASSSLSAERRRSSGYRSAYNQMLEIMLLAALTCADWECFRRRTTRQEVQSRYCGGERRSRFSRHNPSFVAWACFGLRAQAPIVLRSAPVSLSYKLLRSLACSQITQLWTTYRIGD